MVDVALLAVKIAMIRDAVTRIESVRPASVDAFRADRTAREVVSLNLFVAIQECVAVASHVLADAGWGVPRTYGESFAALAEHGVLTAELASRLRAAAGLRNLLAHQYGVIDLDRLFEFSVTRTGDLDAFCAAIATRFQDTDGQV